MLPLAGRGEGRRQPVHADDLAAACLLALDRPETFGPRLRPAGRRDADLPRHGGARLRGPRAGARASSALPPPLWRLGLALAAPLLPGATAAMGERMAEDLVFDGAAGGGATSAGRPRPVPPALPRRRAGSGHQTASSLPAGSREVEAPAAGEAVDRLQDARRPPPRPRPASPRGPRRRG